MGLKYNDIKIFYRDILEAESICSNINVPITEFTDYVMAVYDEIEEVKFNGYKKYASAILGIEQKQFKELMLDAIYSNLYCDIMVILQNMVGNKSRIRHEMFLTNVEFNSDFHIKVTRSSKERFRRRMQPNRLNLVKKFKIKSSDEDCFYSPSLIRAFKETLLVKRPGTEIMDISQCYADVFFSLMFDSDEEVAIAKLKNSREIIKSYRLWKLTNEGTDFILNIYQTVLENPLNGDKFAQLMLLEKLFGVYTVAELIVHKKEDAKIVESLSPMCNLGYCSLHNVLSEKVSSNNYGDMGEVVYEYIHPFCVYILTEITRSILKFIENLDDEQSVEFLTNVISDCKRHIKSVFSSNSISYLTTASPDMVTTAIKTITGFGDIRYSNSIKKYISNYKPKVITTRFYDSKYRGEIRPKRLFEKSFIDLTYTIKKRSVKKSSKNILGKILFPFFNKQ